MSKTELQELIMSDEQLDEISKNIEKQADDDWCVQTLLKIKENMPDYKEHNLMDKIFLVLRFGFFMGHREALELMREAIRLECAAVCD